MLGPTRWCFFERYRCWILSDGHLQTVLLDGLKRQMSKACIDRSDSLIFQHKRRPWVTKYKKIYFGFTYASSEVHFRSTESQTFYWSIMTADDSIKCRCANSGMTGQVGGFQNPGVCLQAFPSFLPHPLPAFTYAILLCLPQYLDFWFKIWTMATKATSVGSLAL